MDRRDFLKKAIKSGVVARAFRSEAEPRQPA